MKTIKTYLNGIEADQDKSILEANGIRCYLADESSSVIGVSALGLRLQVEDSDAQRATEILKDQLLGVPLLNDVDEKLDLPNDSISKTDLRIAYGGFGLLFLVILAIICKNILQR